MVLVVAQPNPWTHGGCDDSLHCTDSLLGFSRSVLQVVADFRYEEPVRSATASGPVEEHSVGGALQEGTELDVRVCVVADVRDGSMSELGSTSTAWRRPDS